MGVLHDSLPFKINSAIFMALHAYQQHQLNLVVETGRIHKTGRERDMVMGSWEEVGGERLGRGV